ncbi:hypothetical protein D3C87_1357640 [compost metagenome]
MQAAADQVVDPQFVERAVLTGTQGLKEGKQAVVFNAQIGDVRTDAKHVARQQKPLALRLPEVFVGITAQHGDLVQLAQFRSPAPHQRAAHLWLCQPELDTRQRVRHRAYAHRKSDQFKKTHNPLRQLSAIDGFPLRQPMSAPGSGILRQTPLITEFAAVR